MERKSSPYRRPVPSSRQNKPRKSVALLMRDPAKHETRREQLVKAALNIISTRGFSYATIREVAKEAGCSTGTLSYYVSSREELLMMVADYEAEQSRKQIVTLEKVYKGLTALRQIVRNVLPLDQTRDFRWKFWFNAWEEISKCEAGRKWLENRQTESVSRYRKHIQTAQKMGEVPASVNAALAAGSLVALIDGIGVQVFIGRQNLSGKKQLELFESWVQGILMPLI